MNARDKQEFTEWFGHGTGYAPSFQTRFTGDPTCFQQPSPSGRRKDNQSMPIQGNVEQQIFPTRRRKIMLNTDLTTQHAIEPIALGTVFSPHLLVFQLKSKETPYQPIELASTLTVAGRWREAILSYSNGLSEPVRRILSGHHPNGSAAEGPHLAFMPLAFIGHEQADGHVLGMGLVLPNGISRGEHHDALHAIAAVRELKLGPLGVWDVESVMASRPAWNLRPETWTAHSHGATHWSTVTPVVFDRHPKTKDKAEYQQEAVLMIAEACTRIGLPKPREVIVTQVSAHLGVPPSFRFPRLQRKDGSERRHTHAILVFDEPVCGPMLIGAGRFRGYGGCRPLDGDDETKQRKPQEETAE